MPAETPHPSRPERDTTDVRAASNAASALPHLPGLDHLPTPELVEAVLVHQRQCWGQGDRVPVGRYLERYEALRADADAGADVVYQEYVLRAGGEDGTLFDDYVRQYPQYAMALRGLYEADQVVRQVFHLDTPPAPGKPPRRFRDYELLEELGRGGMGVVWKARQVSLDRIVALKMILAGELASGDAVERFHNEARAAAALRHPNIVAIHEVGREEGLHFFSMEFVEGETLAQAVRDNPLPAEKAARYVEAVASAIHHAHRQGVLHRDLKPSNILVDQFDQPRVTDFGLARQVEGDQKLTGTGQVLGTPSYMPPEQATGRRGEVGPASDVYSLGAVLYELLTGKPPFQAATTFDTLMLVVGAEPVAPRALNPRIPRDLDTVCLKCLQKDARQRYASAEDLADDLARFLRGEPVRARPVGPAGRFWRWCRRAPVVAGLTVGLVVALLGGVAAVSWQLRRVERHRADAEYQRDVAEEERERAQVNLEKAMDAVDFIGKRIGELRMRNVPQLQAVQREVLEYALKFHEGFLAERGEEPAVRLETARAWFRVGTIRSALGLIGQAEAAYRAGIALAEGLPDENPGAVERLQALIDGYHRLRVLYRGAGRAGDVELIEPTLERMLDSYPENRRNERDYRHCRAVFLGDKAQRIRRHHPGESIELSRQAISLLRVLATEHPEEWQYKKTLGGAIGTLAGTLREAKRLGEARPHYQESLAIYQQLVDRSPGEAGLLQSLALTCRNLGPLLRAQKEYAQAEGVFGRAEVAFLKLTQDFPDLPQHQYELGQTYHSWGLLRQEQRRNAEALSLFEKAAACQRKALVPDPKNYTYRIALCGHCYQIADYHLSGGDHGRAARAAADMAGAAGARAADFTHAASLFARCVTLARQDPKLPSPKREEVANRYAAQAIRTLRLPEAGPPHEHLQILTHPAFNALKGYEEFKEFLRDAEAKGHGK